MARTVIAPSRPPNLIIRKADVKAALEKLITQGKEIQDSQISSEEDLNTLEDKKTKWINFVKEYLERAFDSDGYAHDFSNSYGPMRMASDISDQIDNFNNDIRAKLTTLESINERLDLIPDPLGTTKPDAGNEPIVKESSDEVFVVHGHDEDAKNAVAGYIRSLELKPIILHEQANGGRTLIEKLEHYSTNVGYAIVIATPDDMGYEKGENHDSAKPRPRQNVTMELGYFVGKLTRKNVCLLYKEGTELPTDLLGIVYIPFDDNGNWKLAIAKELKSANIKFNTDAAFS